MFNFYNSTSINLSEKRTRDKTLSYRTIFLVCGLFFSLSLCSQDPCDVTIMDACVLETTTLDGYPDLNEYVTCGSSDTFSIIISTAGLECLPTAELTDISLDIYLPAEHTFIEGSVEAFEGSYNNPVSSGESTGTPGVVTITLGAGVSLDQTNNIIINYQMRPECLSSSLAGPIYTGYRVYYTRPNGSQGNEFVGGQIDLTEHLKTPKIIISNSKTNPTVGNVGGTLCRTVEISHVGDGALLDEFHYEDRFENESITLTSFEVNGTDALGSVSVTGGVVSLDIDGASYNSGNAFASGDKTELSYCFIVDCPSDGGYGSVSNNSELSVSWGCDGQVCDEETSIESAIAEFVDFPELKIASQPRDEPSSICADSGPVCYRYKYEVENFRDEENYAGEGTAYNTILKFYLNQCFYRNEFNNEIFVDLMDYNNFTLNGNPVSPLSQSADLLEFDVQSLYGEIPITEMLVFEMDICIRNCVEEDCGFVLREEDSAPTCIEPEYGLTYEDGCNNEYETREKDPDMGIVPFIKTQVQILPWAYEPPGYCSTGQGMFRVFNSTSSSEPGGDVVSTLRLSMTNPNCDFISYSNFGLASLSDSTIITPIPPANISYTPTSIDFDLNGNIGNADIMDQDGDGEADFASGEGFFITFDMDVSCFNANDGEECYNSGDGSCNWENLLTIDYTNCQGINYQRDDEFPTPMVDQNVNGDPRVTEESAICGRRTIGWTYNYIYAGLANCDSTAVYMEFVVPEAYTIHTVYGADCSDCHVFEEDTRIMRIYYPQAQNIVRDAPLFFGLDYSHPTPLPPTVIDAEIKFECYNESGEACCEFTRACIYDEYSQVCSGPVGEPPVLTLTPVPPPPLPPCELNTTRVTFERITTGSGNATELDYVMACDEVEIVARGEMYTDNIDQLALKLTMGRNLIYQSGTLTLSGTSATVTCANLTESDLDNLENCISDMSLINSSTSFEFRGRYIVDAQVADIACSEIGKRKEVNAHFRGRYQGDRLVSIKRGSCGAKFTRYYLVASPVMVDGDMIREGDCMIGLELDIKAECPGGEDWFRDEERPQYLIDDIVITIPTSGLMYNTGDISLVAYYDGFKDTVQIGDGDVLLEESSGVTTMTLTNNGSWPEVEMAAGDTLYHVFFNIGTSSCINTPEIARYESVVTFDSGNPECSSARELSGFVEHSNPVPVVLSHIDAGNKLIVLDTAYWQVSVESPSGNLTWFALEDAPGNYSEIQVTDIATGTVYSSSDLGNGVTMVELGSGEELYNLQIRAITAECEEVCMNIFTGASCAEYPVDPTTALYSDGSSCAYEQSTLCALREDPLLQGSWTQVPPEDGVALCESFDYVIQVENIKKGADYSQYMTMFIPEGLEIEQGSWMLSYPDDTAPSSNPSAQTGNFVSIPDATFINNDPITGNEYQMDLVAAQAGLDPNFIDFLPGVRDPEDNLNSFLLKFSARTSCEFLSGGQISTTIESRDRCDEPVDAATFVSPQIIVTGANPNDFSKYAVSLLPNEILACSGDNRMTLAIKGAPYAVQPNEFVCVLLPLSMNYSPNTINKFSPVDGHPDYTAWDATPTETEVEIDGETLTEFCFPLPEGFPPGEQMVFSFGMSVDDAATCGEYPVQAYTAGRFDVVCTQNNFACPITFVSSPSVPDTLTLKPGFSYEEADQQLMNVRLGCSSTDDSQLNAQATISFTSGAYVPADTPINIIFYHDSNGDGDHTGESEVHIETINQEIFPDQMVTISNISFDVPATESCPLLAQVLRGTDCACSNEPIALQNVTDIGDLFEFTSYCPGVPVTLGCANTPPSGGGVSYTWSSSDDPGLNLLDLSDPSNPVFLSELEQTYRYEVSIDFGGCNAMNEVVISPTKVLDLEGKILGFGEVCQNDTMTLVASVMAEGFDPQFYDYNWDYDGGVITNPGVAPGTVELRWDTPGTKTISVELTSALGGPCMDPFTMTREIVVLSDESLDVSLTIDQAEFCTDASSVSLLGESVCEIRCVSVFDETNQTFIFRDKAKELCDYAGLIPFPIPDNFPFEYELLSVKDTANNVEMVDIFSPPSNTANDVNELIAQLEEMLEGLTPTLGQDFSQFGDWELAINGNNIEFTVTGLPYCTIYPMLIDVQSIPDPNAQTLGKHGNVWIFGRNALVDFNTDPPTVGTSPAPFSTNEGCSTYSDPATGELLLYTDGRTVYNSQGGVIIDGMAGNSSSTHSGVIVPRPGACSDNEFIVIGNDFDGGTSMSYSIVKVLNTADAGSIIQGDTPLPGFTIGEIMVVAPHANGDDWWFIEPYLNELRISSVTNAGVSAPITYNIPFTIRRKWENLVSNALGDILYGYCSSGTIKIDFDNSTGIPISTNVITPFYGEAHPNLPGALAGFCLSSDESKLYSFINKEIRQVDLANGNLVTIVGDAGPCASVREQLELAPDGKIYMSNVNCGGSALSVINSPNSAGIACDFTATSFPLASGTSSVAGLPMVLPPNVKTCPAIFKTTIGLTDRYFAGLFNPYSSNYDLDPGDYCIRVEDCCESYDSCFTIAEPPALDLTVVPTINTTATCMDMTGSIDVTVESSAPIRAYIINGPEKNDTIRVTDPQAVYSDIYNFTGLAAGLYDVEVVTSCGSWEETLSVESDENDIMLTETLTQLSGPCGSDDGSISIDIGVAASSMIDSVVWWQDGVHYSSDISGGMTSSITGLIPGVYSTIVYTSCGQAIGDWEIVSPPASSTVTANIEVTNPADCGELGSAAISLTVSPTAQLDSVRVRSEFLTDMYADDTGALSFTATDLFTGSYTLEVYSTEACIADTVAFELGEAETGLVLDAQRGGPYVCPATETTLVVEWSQTSSVSAVVEWQYDFSFQEQHNPTSHADSLVTNIAGDYRALVILPNCDTIVANYTVSYTDCSDLECMVDIMPTITPNLGCDAVSYDVSVSYDAMGSSVDAYGANDICYTVSWENVVTGDILAATDTQADLAAGVYKVAVSAYVCSDNTPLCSKDRFLVLDDYPDNDLSLDVVVANTECGFSNGTAEVVAVTGGMSPSSYSYIWRDMDGNDLGESSEKIMSLSAGLYTVGILLDGCEIATRTVSINPLDAPPVAILNVSPSSNCGPATGRIVMQKEDLNTGFTFNHALFDAQGNEYFSEPFPNKHVFNNLPIGSYTVQTFTSPLADACPVYQEIEIEIDPSSSLMVEGTPRDVSLCGSQDGRIFVQGTGGDGNYSYVLSKFGMIEDTQSGGVDDVQVFSGLGEGEYKVEVISNGGDCRYELMVRIGNETFSIDPDVFTTTSPSCFMTADGEITITSNIDSDEVYDLYDSEGALVASLNATSSPRSFTGLAEGVYTVELVKGTAPNSCSETLELRLESPAPILVEANASPSQNCPSPQGSVQITASGGDGNYSIAWSTAGMSGFNPNYDGAGPFLYTVTDGNGCSYDGSFDPSLPAPEAPLSTFDVAYCLDSDEAVALTAVASGPGEIVWFDAETGGNELGADVIPPTSPEGENIYWAGMRYLGCDGPRIPLTVTIYDSPPFDPAPDLFICDANEFNLDGNPLADGLTGTWYTITGGLIDDPAAEDPLVTNVGYGDHLFERVIGTDECIARDTVAVFVSIPPELTLTPSNPTCLWYDGEIVTTVTGGDNHWEGEAPYIYLWSDGSTAANLSNARFGTYTVTVTDANNCTVEATASLDMPAGCMDVALIKELDVIDPVVIGQDVTFNITVCNQGPTFIDSLEVTDYIPTGFGLNDADWTAGTVGSSGQSASIELSTANGLLPTGGLSTSTAWPDGSADHCVFVPITLTVQPGANANNVLNYAEISYEEDIYGTTIDIDSTPDAVEDNDGGGLVESEADNHQEGDGTGTIGDGVAATDEDDHDPALVRVVDIALAKTTVTAGPYTYGQLVTFDIEVTNQGNVDLTDIQVTDYLPCGFGYSASNDGVWSYDGTVATTDIASLSAGSSTNVQISLEVLQVSVSCDHTTAYTNYAEVSYMEDDNGVNVSLLDIDSDADGNDGNDAGGTVDTAEDDHIDDDGLDGNGDGITDEDDHDPERIEIFDLALRKVLTTPSPYSYGDDLTFTITVYNQGNVTASNIEVTDYIPSGYVFDGGINGDWSGTSPDVTTNLPGTLLPGDSLKVDITLELIAAQSPTAWDNYAEISGATDGDGQAVIDIDSTPDANDSNDNNVVPGDAADNVINDDGSDGDGDGITDEDDHDPAAPRIVDIALAKTTVTAGPYTYGQLVTFDIEVTNQGNVDLTDIQVTDYLPCGFGYSASNDGVWSYDGTVATTDITSLSAGSSTNVQISLEVLQVSVSCDHTTAYTNYAEVSYMEDDNGVNVSLLDIDSDADGNDGNDAGGSPDTAEDDHIDDDGLDGNGDGITDEDDHDPERIEIFDLALRKTINNAGPYVPESFLDFEIAIINQGNVYADNILITDYFPDCFVLVDPMWTDNSNSTASYDLSVANGTLNTPLAPGDSMKISIRLKNNVCQPGYEINWAEISAATNGIGSSVIDVDSTPDTTRDNDGGGAPGYDTDNWVDGQGGGIPFDEDNPGGPGDDDRLGDEDDQDPEQVEVILFADLALIKVLGQNQINPVNPGDVVNFDIIVQNQGLIEVDSFVVNDYMPPCLTLISPDWTILGNGSAEHVVSLANGRLTAPMQTGDQYIIPISFIVDPCANGVIENWAEISDFRGPGGSIIEDVDSYPDDNLDNDNYDPSDNNVWTGDGKNGGDEDDHDPEQIIVIPENEMLFDLALRKVLADGQSQLVTTGEIVVFEIEVFNQGTIAADNIVITDYFPSCFSMVDADWTDNGNNTGQIELNTNNGGLSVPLQPGQGIRVEINLLLANCPSGDLTNWAEISAATDIDGNTRPDVDSTPDNDQSNDNYNGTDNVIDQNGKNGGDEDDHDPEVVTVTGNNGLEFDLALIKVKANGQPNPVEDGDIVTFEIEVKNQGEVSADNIEITDYLPSCLDLLDEDWTDNNNGTATIMLSVANGALMSPLLPGDGVSVFITTVVNGCPPGPITNWAEISGNTNSGGQPVVDVDSTPDNDQTNDTFVDNNQLDGDGKNGVGDLADEDDHDPESITILETVESLDTFDLALFKVLHPGQTQEVMNNDVAVFDIEVTNQGNMLADNIEITDYVPSCLALNDSNWSDNNDGTASILLSVANDGLTSPLAPGQSVRVTIRFTVLDCADNQIINWAEISESTDAFGNPVIDIDSTPDNNQENDLYTTNNDINGDGMNGEDEDDHDPESLLYIPPPPVYDIALIKTLSLGQATPVSIGDNVSFDIQVTNQGDYTLDNINIIDYLPNCLSLDDSNWIDNNDGTVSHIIPGALAPNQSIIIPIKVLVDPCADGILTNWAEVSSFTNGSGEVVEDIDSTPDTNPINDNYPPGSDNINTGDGKNGEDEDDHDPEDIYVIPITPISFDLALTKVLATGQPSVVGPESSVTFEIEIFNQSDMLADNIEITDYLPSCTVLNDSNWLDNNDGTASIILSVANGGLMSPLGQNESISIPITIQLTTCASGTIVNWAEISGATNDSGNNVVDIDSTPDSDPNNDNYDNSDNVTDENGRNGGDEDDHDPAEVTIDETMTFAFDLALTKILAPGEPSLANNGDQVDFMITVFNQGDIAADNIEITDYLPSCLKLNDSDWIDNNDGTASITLSVANGGLMNPLQPMQSIPLYITVELEGCPASTIITNWAEISESTDALGNPVIDIDSTPDNDPNNDRFVSDNDVSGDAKGVGEDEDDHDPASITSLGDNTPPAPGEFDLALIKVLQTGQPAIVENGDIIMFDIFITNQGDIAADNIEIIDYMHSCMSLSDPDWTDNIDGTASIVLSVANGGLPAPLGPGDFLQVPINVQLNGCPMEDISNWAEISSTTDGDGLQVIDVDSTPDDILGNDIFDGDNEINGDGKTGSDEDDHDPAVITVMDMELPIFDLALTKTLPFGQTRNVPIGSVITFDINVMNQGTILADNIELVDYLPSCSILQDSDWIDNGDGSASIILSVANGGLMSPLAIGQTVTVPITINLGGCGFGEVWNWAEISNATDENGDTVTDIDSWPDTSDTNDIYTTDNYTGGDGNIGEDEDDHDGEYVFVDILEEEKFDLALLKRLVPGQDNQVSNGEIVTFEISVINQGNVAADQIRLVDYIPTCMSLADANWTFAGSNLAVRYLSVLTGELDGPLSPGEQVKVTISLLTNGCPSGPILNWAEIQAAVDGNGDSVTDVDSTPDSTFPNDIFTGDDVIDGDGKNGGDEDDHDVAEIELVPSQVEEFDLALIKVIAPGQSTVVEEGDVFTFDIQITNQGDIAADNIRITDYYPSCLILTDNDWLDNGDETASLVLSVANAGLNSFLQPGQSVVVPITFTVGFCQEGDHFNFAEISDATDPMGSPVVDIDSTPDNDPDNDNYDDSDNITDENGKNGGDEDDHDPEVFTVSPIFDLALRKLVTSSGPYRYGDPVDFSITIYNQGNQQASNIEITDYMPEGYSFDENENTGWSIIANSKLQFTYNGIIDLNDQITIPLRLRIEQTEGGYRDWDNYAEISDATDENGNTVIDTDSYPDDFPNNDNDAMVGDSNDNEIDENGVEGGDEDDHDPAGIDIFDLALIKVAEDQDRSILYGDLIDYRFTVFNQGNIPARNVEITDYLPCGLEYVGSNNAIWSYDASAHKATTVIGGTIVPGSFAEVVITLRVIQCIDMNVHSFTNFAEISNSTDENGDTVEDIDSMTDADPDNDMGGTPNNPEEDDVITGDKYDGEDEDDHDPESIEVFDLALIKELVTINNPYRYGDILDFKITVCNQGNVDAANIIVTDYLPAGYHFEFSNNPGWAGTTNVPTYTIPGVLVQDQCTDFHVFVTIQQTAGGEKDWVNYVEIGSSTDLDGTPRDDADSMPGLDTDEERDVEPGDHADNDLESTDKGGEEDDHDPAGIELFDLALRKTSQNQQNDRKFGDVVDYNIEVFNQGSIEASNIEISEYIPCGLKYLSSNDAIGWSYDIITSKAHIVLNDNLAAGDSSNITLKLQLQECYEDGEVADAWTNYAEISNYDSEDSDYENPEDVDSMTDTDPDNDLGGAADDPNEDNNINGDKYNDEDEDDHDPDRVDIFDLALRKVSTWMGIDSLGPFVPGDIVEFHIDVFNQGNVDAYGVIITDYLRSGYVFDVNNDNAGWSMNMLGMLEYELVGPLLAGDSIKSIMNLEVQVPTGAQSGDWYNEAEISEARDEDGEVRDDIDSMADADPDNDNDLVDGADADNIFNGDENDNEIDEHVDDPYNEGDDDEDDNDAAEILVTSSIGDTVWKDLDGDGVRDPNEPGVVGVQVVLTRCDGAEMDAWVQDTVYTDSEGKYLFDQLLPSILNGGYKVRFNLDYVGNVNDFSDCDWTYQDSGEDDREDSDVDMNGCTECIDLAPGVRDTTWDAGLLVLSSVGDYVWHDIDGDGIQDGNEPGISGVVVMLLDEFGNMVGITETDGSGMYLFEELYPGNYYLKFTAPAGMDLTFANEGFIDGLDSDVDGSNGEGTTTIFSLGVDDHPRDWDAGYYFCVPIGELVWYDANMNDMWEDEENGINGLVVKLMRRQLDGSYVMWESMYTGHKPGTPSDDGYYKFCAPPGNYYVEVLLPPMGLVAARAGQGPEDRDSDGNNVGITPIFDVLSGEEKCDIGHGFYPMSSVGDRVWRDENGNGKQDVGEAMVEGVVVKAYDMEGEMINSSVTGDDGRYEIDYLGKDEYYLKFELPVGYGLTTSNVGSDDSVDSDVDGSNGPGTTRRYSLEPGDAIPHIDAGLVYGAVPLEWLGVRVEHRGMYNELEWETSNEINVSHFDVERRYADEASFVVIGKEASGGDSKESQSYSYKDYDILESGVYYYRLKEVDQDGSSDYSEVVSVLVSRDVEEGLDGSVKVYPNPTVDMVNVDVLLERDMLVSVSIWDASGREVIEDRIGEVLSAGSHNNRIDISSLLNGVYTVKVKMGNSTVNKKLVVMRN